MSLIGGTVKTKTIFPTLALSVTVGLVLACQKAANTTTNASNSENKAAIAQQAATPVEQTVATANIDGSPTEVYKLAYKYRNEKNIEGLKSLFSKEVLDFLADMGASEKKSLDDQVREMTEQPQWSTDESRNEKISGDHAKLEYRDSDGEWRTMDFVKESGKWKLSLPEGDASDEDKPKPKR